MPSPITDHFKEANLFIEEEDEEDHLGVKKLMEQGIKNFLPQEM